MAIAGLFENITRHEFISTLEILSQTKEEDLLAAIQSVVSHETHLFSSTIMAKKFKPMDISRTARALENKNDKLSEIVANLAKKLRKDAEKLLEIRSKSGHIINDAQFIELEKYLRRLEVFALRPCKAFLPVNPSNDDYIQYNQINEMLNAQNIVVQPALRYAQADILLNLIKKDSSFAILTDAEKNTIIEFYLSGVYGIMQEDLILYETMQNCKIYGRMHLWDNYWPRYASLPLTAYKAFFPRSEKDQVDKEIDLIIENEPENKVYLIEIKHSKQKNINQSKWLTDNNVLDRIKMIGKKVVSKTILYRGETSYSGDINYINIEEYLITLHQEGIKAAINLISNTSKHKPKILNKKVKRYKNSSLKSYNYNN